MKLVHGVGLNDAGYAVTAYGTVFGKLKRVWTCPFYLTWQNMLLRCYSKKKQAIYQTYIGCSVVGEWLTFSKFRKWMEEQDWNGLQLDKDILISGNKVYGPETCVFVDQTTNKFMNDHGAARGDCPIGVYLHRPSGKFISQCSNPFAGKTETLGCFTDPASAHKAWRTRKHELALLLADRQTDERVAAALLTRFL